MAAPVYATNLTNITTAEHMIQVVGVWEQGWNTPFLEHDLWVYPLQEFGVDSWYMSPVSGIAKSPMLIEVADVQYALDAHPESTVVWVDERADTLLQDFQHPENAIYVAGRTSQSVLGRRKAGDLSVCVETTHNGGGLWAHQAVVMVLYDRLVKSWR